MKTLQTSENATDAKALIANAKSRSEKAVKLAEQLAAKEMNEEHKEVCQRFIANAKNAEAELKANRMPLTRKMDAIKADFTATEKAIKEAADKVNASINTYVTKLARAKQEKERQIRAAADLERRKLEHYDKFVQAFTDGMRKALDSITLENYIDKKDVIENKKFSIKRSHFANFTPKQPDSWLDEMEAKFQKDVEAIRLEIINFLPEIKKQLQAGKEVKVSDKVEVKSTIKEDVQATKMEELQQLMNVEDGPEAKRYYEIEIVKKKGIVDLFHYWYLHDGQTMPLDKVGTMSIDRMRRYAEKMAGKGEFIESENLQYHEKYKA